MSIAFVITTLVVVVTPGTGALFTVAAGISRGRRAALIAAFGCTLGIVPHLVAAVAGMAALLNASAVAFQSLKYLGVAYLLFLAWRTFRDRTPVTVDTDQAPQAALRVIGQAIAINVLNPKLTLFFFAFLPQFVRPDAASPTWTMIGLSLVFMAVTWVIFSAYGVFAAAARNQVLARPRVMTWLRRAFAGSYVLLAGRLAVTER